MDYRFFSALNRIRCEESFHMVEDWSLNDWFVAALGELGEAANIAKKIKRGDYTMDEMRGSLGKELADALTYIDLIAQAAGIDLMHAACQKFNEVSDRVGSECYFAGTGVIFRIPASFFDGEIPNARHMPGLVMMPKERKVLADEECNSGAAEGDKVHVFQRGTKSIVVKMSDKSDG